MWYLSLKLLIGEINISYKCIPGLAAGSENIYNSDNEPK